MLLADKGVQAINLRATGSSMRYTVLSGVSMSGEKLAPLVVFKGVTDAQDPKGIHTVFLSSGKWFIVVRQRHGEMIMTWCHTHDYCVARSTYCLMNPPLQITDMDNT